MDTRRWKDEIPLEKLNGPPLPKHLRVDLDIPPNTREQRDLHFAPEDDQ